MFQILVSLLLSGSAAQATAPKQVCFLNQGIRYVVEAPWASMNSSAHVTLTRIYRSGGQIEKEVEGLTIEPRHFRNGGVYFSLDLRREYTSVVYERTLEQIEIEAEVLYPDGWHRELGGQLLTPSESPYSALRCELHAS